MQLLRRLGRSGALWNLLNACIALVLLTHGARCIVPA
jgi:hypothetical protein